MKIKHVFATSLLALTLCACKPSLAFDAFANNVLYKTQQAENDNGWTIMVYMCGSTLEYDGGVVGLATMDIREMLSVKNQPDNVNIVIQTGGAQAWASNYGIRGDKSEIYHIRNNKLVKDASNSNKNMGSSSTLQSFVEYGLKKYPAKHNGFIFWNHGGAMMGCCNDENYSGDSLLNSEVSRAFKNAFKTMNRTEKLDWVGYDACLMSVQDIAEFNSHYFKYMVASEQTEAGYGWAYDDWLPTLYNKKPTTEILSKIADSFINSINVSYGRTKNDQTLAVLDLSKMASYKKSFESLASAMNKLSISKSSFVSLMNTVKTFGDKYSSYYGIFDAYNFFNRIIDESVFSSCKSKIKECKSAYEKLIYHFAKGQVADDSSTKTANGMCLFFPISANCYSSEFYTASQTNFTNWRSFCLSHGY